MRIHHLAARYYLPVRGSDRSTVHKKGSRKPKRHQTKATNPFANSLYAQLYTVPFPVFLQLCEILDALLRHLPLIDFVFIIAQGATHLKDSLRAHAKLEGGKIYLQRVYILHSLDGGNKVRKIGDGRKGL